MIFVQKGGRSSIQEKSLLSWKSIMGEHAQKLFTLTNHDLKFNHFPATHYNLAVNCLSYTNSNGRLIPPCSPHQPHLHPQKSYHPNIVNFCILRIAPKRGMYSNTFVSSKSNHSMDFALFVFFNYIFLIAKFELLHRYHYY